MELLHGSGYSVWETGLKMPMIRAFSNLKTSVVRHLETHTHKKAFEKELNEEIATDKTKEDIFILWHTYLTFPLNQTYPSNNLKTLLEQGVSVVWM